MHKDLQVILKCKAIITDWLKDIGLEFKPSKTKISHTLSSHEGNSGFDFLGFNVRQYRVGKHKSAKNCNGEKLGFKTFIVPSSKSLQKHYHNIANIIDRHSNAPQAILISRLNPVIRGWANYFSTVCSKRKYSLLDSLMWKKLWGWAKYRCSGTRRKVIVNKYWGTIKGDNWVFLCKQDNHILSLEKYSKTEIQRHIKVKDVSSPYNGDTVYWSTRRGRSPEMPARITGLLKAQ